MDKTEKILFAIVVLLITVGITTYAVIAITETPVSEGIVVALGDNAPLPLAKNCKIYAEYLCVNDRDYNFYQDYVISDKQIVIKCGDRINKVGLTISTTNNEGKISSQVMSLPVGGVWIFNDAEKEYLIFFMGTWEKDTQGGGKEISVRLRVKQL